jgi:hypothetical protein
VKVSFAKACLGEGLASCDNCGHAAPTEEIATFYFGEHGEKLDLCRRCLERDDWGERW